MSVEKQSANKKGGLRKTHYQIQFEAFQRSLKLSHELLIREESFKVGLLLTKANCYLF